MMLKQQAAQLVNLRAYAVPDPSLPKRMTCMHGTAVITIYK